MTNDELTLLLGGWEGYRLTHVERREAPQEGGRPELHLTLEPRADRVKRCCGCGDVVEAVHDCDDRLVRDLPILDANTWLHAKRCRLACPRCGPKLEELSWLGRYARVTRRLAESVARCAVSCRSSTWRNSSPCTGARSRPSIMRIWRRCSGRSIWRA